MGGLRKQLPKVYFCMMIGALALSGIFPFSGGFSKDAILSSALAVDTPIGWIAYIGGLIGALLTGIYTFRLMFMVFHRRMSPYAENVIPHSVEHHGEGPSTMLWPVYILSIGAAFAGLLQIPGLTHVFSSWLEPISPYGMVEATASQDWFTTLIGSGVGLIGIAIAYHLYARENDAPELIRNGHARLIHRALERRLYWDDLYEWTFERPLQWASGFLNRDVGLPLGAARWPWPAVRLLRPLVHDHRERHRAHVCARDCARHRRLDPLPAGAWLDDHRLLAHRGTRRRLDHLAAPAAWAEDRGLPGAARVAGRGRWRDWVYLPFRAARRPAVRRQRGVDQPAWRALACGRQRRIAGDDRDHRADHVLRYRLRHVGSPRALACLVRPDSHDRGVPDHRLLGARPRRLLRGLRGHADPAARPARRMGRHGT